MQQNILEIILPLLFVPLLLTIYWRLRLKRLKTYHSDLLGNIEIFEKYNKEKVLTINKYIQGVSVEDPSIEKSYWYKISEITEKFCQKRKTADVLMLGLGSATICHLIAQKNSHINQTVVEIDSNMIQACQDFFQLKTIPNLEIIQKNAYKIINQKQFFKDKFDVLIVDIYIGHPPFVSLKSNQPPFIQKSLSFLKNDGIIIFNKPAHTEEARNQGLELKKYLLTLFEQVEIFDIKDPRGHRNYVIAAKNQIT